MAGPVIGLEAQQRHPTGSDELPDDFQGLVGFG